MTPYLTATQAASKLGKSEKTIRRWIKEGRLHAHHPNGRPNLLAISEDDIEQLATELAQYEQKDTGEDTSSLEHRVKQLEQELNNYRLLSGPDLLALGPEDMVHVENRLDSLESRIVEIERVLSVGTPAQPAERATRTRTPHASATYEIPERLPQGSMPYHRFAELHGVPARTFLDHIDKGHVPAIVRQRPNRKEKARWLSPEQQRQAISYWQANGTSYHDCDLCPHTDEVYQRASQDQEETA